MKLTLTSFSLVALLVIAASPLLAQKKYQYAHLSAGDCQVQGGEIIFNPDGTGVWDAQVRTKQTGGTDVWHIQFVAHGSDGKDVIGNLNFDSPGMQGTPSPWIHWRVTFSFEASRYDAIASMTQASQC